MSAATSACGFTAPPGLLWLTMLLPLLLAQAAADSAAVAEHVAQDPGSGIDSQHVAASQQAAVLPTGAEPRKHPHSSRTPKPHLMRKDSDLPLGGFVGNELSSLYTEYEDIEAKALNNPLKTLNDTATTWANETQKEVQTVEHMNSSSEVFKAMHVHLNGQGDTNALLASMIFSSAGCTACFALFYFLRKQYPMLYSHHGPADYTVRTIPKAVVIKEVGLDAWMLMSFHELAMKIFAGLFLLVLVFCPYHWFTKDASVGSDPLFRLSLAGVKENSGIMWAHAVGMYYVVGVTLQCLIRFKEEFTQFRYDWLRRMPAPRATTLLVECIPDQVCNDRALTEYFQLAFSSQAIVMASVVRKTKVLEEKIARLEKLKKQPSAKRQSRGSQERRQSVEIQEVEVAAERTRLTVAQHTFDPDVCADCGFVTFATRTDARRALHSQLGDDNHQFILSEAPDPQDVIFDSLAAGRATLSQIAGWSAVLFVFTVFAPLVLFISGIMSMDSLKSMIPALASLRTSKPWLNAVVDGIFATVALSGLMAALPTVLHYIIQRFFRPVSAARSRLFLEQLYFTFQLVFVLLVTAIGHGFFTTLVFLAENPTGILPLLARSLPAASNFYSAYIVLGWFSCMFELVRSSSFVKYLSLKSFMEPESAREHVEQTSEVTGERYANSALMVSVVLVFSSLSPVILLFGIVYFATCRAVHGYLCCFAEPRRVDLGGEFWVAAVKQIHVGLIVYVLLMLGVLSSFGAGPVIVASPTLVIVVVALYNFDGKHVWQTLPFQALASADASGEAANSGAGARSYLQPGFSHEEVGSGLRRLSAAAESLNLQHISAGDGLQRHVDEAGAVSSPSPVSAAAQGPR